jgi:hypothetical protein
MKYLPHISLSIWLATISAYFFAREFLFNPYVIFPVITILSIFFPVCFWNLQLIRRRIFSTAFVIAFIFNCSWLTYNLVELSIKVSSMEPADMLVLDMKLSNKRFSSENPKERENISRHIYEKSGIISAFTNESGNLELFSPNKIDESAMYQHFSSFSNSLTSKGFLIYYIQGLFLVLAIHLSTFIGILVLLINFEGPGSKYKMKEAN